MSALLTPRKAESKNWTGLPEEFRMRATSVFEQNFRDEKQRGQFLIDGRIYPREIVVRAGFREAGRLKQVNFEVSMDHSPDQRAMEKLFIAVDALGAIFETYFEHEREGETDDVEYPIAWQEFDFEETPLHLRYSTTNTDLEAEADRLLGLEDQALYQDEILLDAEDALDRAEIDNELAQDVSRKIQAGEYVPHLSEEQLAGVTGTSTGTPNEPTRVFDDEKTHLH